MIILKDLIGLLTVSQNIIVKDEETTEVLFELSPISLLFDRNDPIINKEVTHISASDKNILQILVKH